MYEAWKTTESHIKKEKESAVLFWEEHNGCSTTTRDRSTIVEDGRREPEATERTHGNRRLILNSWTVVYWKLSKQCTDS